MDKEHEVNKFNALQTALNLNRRYQAILRDQLHRIEQAQQRNQELHKKIRLLVTQSGKNRTNKSQPVKKQAGSYFLDADGNKPPDNLDAKKKNEELRIPQSFKSKKWTKPEIGNLAKIIRQQNQQILVRKVMEQFQAGGNCNLDAYNREMERIRNMTEHDLERDTSQIDWEKVAKEIPGRSSIDVKIRWLGNDDPNINNETWTKEEDKKLLSLTRKYKAHDWVSTASELGNNRTPLQCFRRYQRSLNTNMMKGKWTDCEDKILMEAVRRFGEKNWQQVANCLEGRTGQQCLHRWQKTLNPNIRRGHWTAEEDKMLALAVKAYGSRNWIRIQQHVPGRTDVQCRERWVNVLNPDLNNGPWTEEEDQKLKDTINQFGLGKWSLIAQHLYPRTDNQCWRRWKALNGTQVDDYRKTVLKRRQGLVNNFVGREKERPSLTPDDFDLDSASGQQENGKTPKRKHSETSSRKRSKRTRGNDSDDDLMFDDDEGLSFDEDEFLLENSDVEFEESLSEFTIPSSSHPTTQNFKVSMATPTQNMHITLPLVLPSPNSFAALQKLLQLTPNNETNTMQTLLQQQEHNVDFQILCAWFYSLFLYPALVFADCVTK